MMDEAEMSNHLDAAAALIAQFHEIIARHPDAASAELVLSLSLVMVETLRRIDSAAAREDAKERIERCLPALISAALHDGASHKRGSH